jgi:hypothetical protein
MDAAVACPRFFALPPNDAAGFFTLLFLFVTALLHEHAITCQNSRFLAYRRKPTRIEGARL